MLQGQRQQLRAGEPDVPSTSVVNTGAFIKQVLRRGVLQDAEGPSVATEYGVLLPTLNGEHGATVALQSSKLKVLVRVRLLAQHNRNIAQLEEHRSPKPEVAGSKPAVPATLP